MANLAELQDKIPFCRVKISFERVSSDFFVCNTKFIESSNKFFRNTLFGLLKCAILVMKCIAKRGRSRDCFFAIQTSPLGRGR